MVIISILEMEKRKEVLTFSSQSRAGLQEQGRELCPGPRVVQPGLLLSLKAVKGGCHPDVPSASSPEGTALPSALLSLLGLGRAQAGAAGSRERLPGPGTGSPLPLAAVARRSPWGSRAASSTGHRRAFPSPPRKAGAPEQPAHPDGSQLSLCVGRPSCGFTCCFPSVSGVFHGAWCF